MTYAISCTKLRVPATVAWQDGRNDVAVHLAPLRAPSRNPPAPTGHVDGLLSDSRPRTKNGWQLAGDAPYGMQHLLGRAAWSADAARDALYAYVANHLGDPEGDGRARRDGLSQEGAPLGWDGAVILRTLGKVGNCQVGVFLAYAGPAATRYWTGNCTCPGPEPATRPACRRWT